MKKLTKEFFARESTTVAPSLLGKLLVHEHQQGITIGRVVETESYHQNDPASHSFSGRSDRNKAMFEAAGTAYIYLSYGIHYCFNAVTGPKGVGQGVLIRALEPIKGIALMKERRRQDNIFNLCSGPAKLTQAMGIALSHNGSSLLGGRLYFAKDQLSEVIAKADIETSPRIGISKAVDKELRFTIKDSPYLSRR